MPSLSLTVTPLFAALLVLLFVGLSARVIRLRRAEKVAVGSGGSPLLQRAIRVQGNFAEYVPLALILLAFLEVQGRPLWLIHGLGAALLGGRLLHAWGVSRVDEDYRFRVAGMMLTLGMLTVTALVLLGGWGSAVAMG